MRKGIFLVVGALLLAGCAGMESAATSGSTPWVYPPPGMDHYGRGAVVEIFWRCVRPEPGLLVLEGMVVNAQSVEPVRLFEAELVGVDAAGRTRSSGKGAAQDQKISNPQMSPFRISLKEAGGEARFDLYYQYDYFDFHDRQFTARDVCNPTQHRKR